MRLLPDQNPRGRFVRSASNFRSVKSVKLYVHTLIAVLPLLRALQALTVLAAICGLAAPSWAQDSALSKSISSGWKSVVKETSKAAKSVSKAANDALGPQKPKRKKSAKRKSGDGESGGPANDDAAIEKAAASTSNGRKKEKVTAKPVAAPVEDDEGPPVPLVREPPIDRPATATANKPAVATKDAGPRRLPPPPVPANTAGERQAPTAWSASTVDDADDALPKATVVPLKGDTTRKPDRSGKEPAPGKPLPITMIPPKAADGASEPANAWSAEDIAVARANCDAILKNVDAVTVPEGPVREGACGAPAPVRLVSIGKNPAVTLQPQPLVTCDLVAGLSQWMKNDIQPLAKKHLGAGITKIETMSDYSCRMAYGRKGNKLSEHGRANALDIRGFVTAKGEAAHVLEQWGKTERDRQAEAAKTAAENAAAEKASEAAAAAGSKTAVETVSALDGPSGKRPAPAMASLGATGLKPSLHSRSEKAAAAIVPEEPQNKKAQFLRDAHASACRIFGTSLGPESNEAHSNHFHVDMAARKRTKICE
jgi:hypothetical protein